jgi:hypothetical protein
LTVVTNERKSTEYCISKASTDKACSNCGTVRENKEKMSAQWQLVKEYLQTILKGNK